MAIAVLAVAVLARQVLDPWLKDTLPYVTLFGAVAYAVWTGGYRPAVLVSILGYVATSYLFIAPRGTAGPTTVPDSVGLVAYLFTCTVIIALGEAARRAAA